MAAADRSGKTAEAMRTEDGAGDAAEGAAYGATGDYQPGVLDLRRSQGQAAPIVFDSPHSGAHFPLDFGTVVGREDLARVQDSHVDALYAGVTAAGASLLAAQFPRSYIDPNRSLEDLDSRLLDGAWPGVLRPSDKTRLGHGLIWRSFPPDRMMYQRRLSVSEVMARIEGYWRPYHTALEGLLHESVSAFGAVWHINCHSMPAGSSPLVSRRTGGNRADIVLGDRDGRSCDPAFTAFVRDRLTAKGYTVRVNDPYKGAYIVQAYSDPRHGRHSLQIELNRSIYMNERTLERSVSFNGLRTDLTDLAFDIRDYANAAAQPQAAE